MLNYNRTADGCVVAAANATHTTCKCGVLSAFALVERGADGVAGVERIEGAEGDGTNFSDWIVVVLVVSGSVVFVGVVLLAFIVAVCCRTRSASWNSYAKSQILSCFLDCVIFQYCLHL